MTAAPQSTPALPPLPETDVITELRRNFRYDPATGELWWSPEAAQKVAGKRAGVKDKDGYLRIKLKTRMYSVHRIGWALVHGQMPRQHIDHINGERADNRICNLREADRFMNMQNLKGPRIDSRSGFLGVSRAGRGRWKAAIRVEGTTKSLGSFTTPEQAYEAYVCAKRKYHKGCTL